MIDAHHADSQATVRKQMLLLRAAMERAEMVQSVSDARQSVGRFQGGVPAGLSRSLPLVLGLIQRAPMLTPLLSLAVAGARRPLLRKLMLGAGSALLAWKAWQWVADQRAARAAGEAASRPGGL